MPMNEFGVANVEDVGYDFDPNQFLLLDDFPFEDILNDDTGTPLLDTTSMNNQVSSSFSSLSLESNSTNNLVNPSMEPVLMDPFNTTFPSNTNPTDTITNFSTETLNAGNSTKTLEVGVDPESYLTPVNNFVEELSQHYQLTPVVNNLEEFPQSDYGGFATFTNPINLEELPQQYLTPVNNLEELPQSDYGGFASFTSPINLDQTALLQTEPLGMYNSAEQSPPSLLNYRPGNSLMHEKEQQLPLASTGNYFGTSQFFPTQLPQVRRRHSNFASSVDDVLSKDPIGVACFLARVVRPGPGIGHIYKCDICQAEFPDYRAFGGHKKSHKNKNAPAGEGRRLSVKSKSLKGKAAAASSSSNKNKKKII